jgi:sugar lactone lactonase YvrE
MKKHPAWLACGLLCRAQVDKARLGGVQPALSPNQRLLASSEEHSHWLLFYTVNADGTLAGRTRYCWLHNTDNSDFYKKGAMTFDAEGRLYAATRDGIQISETSINVAAGGVVAILAPPAGKPTAVCFGGQYRNALFALSGDRLYKRRMKVSGG